ncbi:hypothetical protein [Stakelama tenebrarum]|uniref:Uncharacterized protein n=1 Tax=Stakelama tenebrarum TaxID=2711215 RepID=A0A6G6Y5G6_9SPHN|nr:hypothetical protein [Sphingosinithalassobacter tenebrarum]QIG80091.1 hypothetical protein G5C33_10070 [Sphingosinithalassobacter tenebrarum]
MIAPPHTQDVERDAALFEDWSAGVDQHGTWLWITKVYGEDVFKVRADTPRGNAILKRLGAVRRPRLGGPGARPDGTEPWELRVEHWRALKQVLPELVHEREAMLRDMRYRNKSDWVPFEVSLKQHGRVLAVFAGRPHPHDVRYRVWATQRRDARALGASIGQMYDRDLWFVPTRHARIEAFRDLASAARTCWI